MEITARDGTVFIRENDRIVGARARFDGQRPRCIFEKVECRPHNLGLAAEAVGILHPSAAGMAGDNLTAVEQAPDRCGHTDLARLAAKLTDSRVERLYAALERIDRHGSSRQG